MNALFAWLVEGAPSVGAVDETGAKAFAGNVNQLVNSLDMGAPVS